jgi:serine O-acetyltransferase
VWSEFSADIKFYRALRYPGGGGRIREALSCLASRGLLVLAVQRFDRLYVVRRSRTGRTAATLLMRVLRALLRALAIVVAKADVIGTTVISWGVYLSDRGFLMIGPQSIGSGTIIHDRVTIGVSAGEQLTPVIGRNVWIGPDCVIYGNITVGDGATILPGSVLSMNVPPNAAVGGNPATILRDHFDNARLRRTLASTVELSASAPEAIASS